MFNVGDEIILTNSESRFAGLYGKVISYYPKYNKLHIQLYRPFTNEDGEQFTEIIYLNVDEDVVSKITKTESDSDAVIRQISILVNNFECLNDEDKKRLGVKYVKMIKELINN